MHKDIVLVDEIGHSGSTARRLQCLYLMSVPVSVPASVPVGKWNKDKITIILKKMLNGLCWNDAFTPAQWLEHRWLQAKVPGSCPDGDSQYFLQTFSVCVFPSNQSKNNQIKDFKHYQRESSSIWPLKVSALTYTTIIALDGRPHTYTHLPTTATRGSFKHWSCIPSDSLWNLLLPLWASECMYVCGSPQSAMLVVDINAEITLHCTNLTYPLMASVRWVYVNTCFSLVLAWCWQGPKRQQLFFSPRRSVWHTSKASSPVSWPSSSLLLLSVWMD